MHPCAHLLQLPDLQHWVPVWAGWMDVQLASRCILCLLRSAEHLRCCLQVDQGLNVKVPLPGGRSFGLSGGLFNRCQATYTE